MKRIVLLIALLPLVVVAQPRLALTRESEAGFRELIRLAQQGAMGPGVVNLNATIQRDRVQIDLKEPGGGTRTLSLRPTTSEEKARFGFFRIEPGENASEADVASLRALLVRVFQTDPFLIENDGMDATRIAKPAPIGEAFHNEGVSGAATALADHASGPSGRAWTLLSSGVAFAALLFALGLVWRTSLRRP